MKKIFLAYLFLLFFIDLKSVFATTDNFKTTASISYLVEENGVTVVNHEITIENLTTEYYADKFSLIVKGTTPQNPKAFENGKSLIILTKKEEDRWVLDIRLDKVVGIGKKRTFEILFETYDFVTKNGSVWEVSIPKEEPNNVYDVTSVTLLTPSIFGKPAYITPKPSSEQQRENLFAFFFKSQDVPLKGIAAAFGNFQVFDFELSYHLENPLNRESKLDIAIPPDTAFQKVILKSIVPKPKNIYPDEENNWLATFELGPREKLDIKVVGAVEIYSSAVSGFPLPSKEYLEKSLLETNLWQVNNPKIQDLAGKLKTPKAIYDYVSSYLVYDYSKVRPNVERLGALGALENQQEAICTEFTDLFIAIARAAGIPAREVNGFAYSENPVIQPLSLVADVLHAWPEYWDEELGYWKPVDPTWGATTGGTDYFSKLDLRHFTFVMHGKDPQKPYPPGSYKLGPNPQKDVFVTLKKEGLTRTESVDIVLVPISTRPWTDSKIKISITNTGNTALYSERFQILFDKTTVDLNMIKFLAPFSTFEKITTVPYSFLGKSTPRVITVILKDQNKSIETYKNDVIVFSLALILFIIILLIFVLFFFVRKTYGKKNSRD